MTLLNLFNGGAGQSHSTGNQKTSILSVRFTPKERARLEELAGTKPLGAYVRERCLGDRAEKRRSLRKPRLEDSQYASLLASFGESRLSSNVNQLARQANMGTLDVSDNIEQELQDACEAILAMQPMDRHTHFTPDDEIHRVKTLFGLVCLSMVPSKESQQVTQAPDGYRAQTNEGGARQ